MKACCDGGGRAGLHRLLGALADARSITATHAYDALHRLTGKTYSNGDPVISYFYDQTSYNGLTITNGKGRRTGMSDAAGGEAWSFDAMGRVLTDRRTTNSITKEFTYQYNLDSSVWKITYPTGRTVEYQANAAGRTEWAKDVANGINYATSASYAPSGALRSVVHGHAAGFAGYTLTHGFNNRLQPATVVATSPSSTLLDFTYDFVDANGKNNGNVDAILNNRNHNRDQSFTYDELNRIKTAQSAATSGGDCWGLQYDFDIWANLLSATVTKCTETQLSQSVNTNNRLIGLTCDASGNVTNDGSYSYTWDAESRMKSGAGVNYTYDGEGRRAKKDNGKLYWYGMGTDPPLETNLSGSSEEEFIFFGGKRIARRVIATSTVFYYFADHLGTSRVIVQASQTTSCYEADYTPYGKERVMSDTCPQNYKFAGKERDAESALDHLGARNYSWNLGRFHSPDLPFIDQHLGDPQSWNLYTYVRNNPIKYVDPTGHALMSPWGGRGDMPAFGRESKGGPIVLSESQAQGSAVPQAVDQPATTSETVLDLVQLGISVFGFVPGVGDAADVVNAGISAMRGNTGDAAFDVAAAATGPLGNTAAVGNRLRKLAKIFKKADNALRIVDDAKVFRSFGELKRVLGPAGDGMDWHHIVEQCRCVKFGSDGIQNTENVVALMRGLHHKINAHYSSKRAFTEGKTVRDWLAGKSFEQQRAYGVQILKDALEGRLQ